MITPDDYELRGWLPVATYDSKTKVDQTILTGLEVHPEAPGKSSIGTRNLLSTLILCLKPKNVLEIGGHIGSASVVMGAALKANNYGKLYTLEPQDHYFKILSETIDNADLKQFITPLKLFSTDPFREIIKDTVDLIYLDANHSYTNALKDLEICEMILSKDGIIVLDDVGKPHSANIDPELRGGVRQALIDFCKARDYSTIFFEHPFWVNPCGLAIASRTVKN